MAKKTMPPIHPGEILQKELLEPLGLTQYRLAKGIGVPPTRINQLVKGRLGISADTALRLSLFFGNSAEFWMNAQSFFDLEVARDRVGDQLKAEVIEHAA